MPVFSPPSDSMAGTTYNLTGRNKIVLEPSSQLARFHNAGFGMLFENSRLNMYFALLPPMSL